MCELRRTSDAVPVLLFVLATLLFGACGSVSEAGEGDAGADDAGGPDAEVLPDERGTLTGIVTSPSLGEGSDETVEGATVSLHGWEEMFATTTDGSGAFSIELPVGIRHVLVEKSGYWGQIYTADMTEAVQAADEVFLATDSFVASIDDMLTDDFDASKGFVFVDFDADNEVGGESATISANSTGAFTFDDSGAAKSSKLLAGGESFVSFYNVEVGTSAVTVTSADGVNACALNFADVQWPVVARTFTSVPVTCSPL